MCRLAASAGCFMSAARAFQFDCSLPSIMAGSPRWLPPTPTVRKSTWQPCAPIASSSSCSVDGTSGQQSLAARISAISSRAETSAHTEPSAAASHCRRRAWLKTAAPSRRAAGAHTSGAGSSWRARFAGAGGRHESNESARFCGASTVTVSTRPGKVRMMASNVRAASGSGASQWPTMPVGRSPAREFAPLGRLRASAARLRVRAPSGARARAACTGRASAGRCACAAGAVRRAPACSGRSPSSAPLTSKRREAAQIAKLCPMTSHKLVGTQAVFTTPTRIFETYYWPVKPLQTVSSLRTCDFLTRVFFGIRKTSIYPASERVFLWDFRMGGRRRLLAPSGFFCSLPHTPQKKSEKESCEAGLPENPAALTVLVQVGHSVAPFCTKFETLLTVVHSTRKGELLSFRYKLGPWHKE